MSDEERLDELLVRWEDEYNQGRDLSPEELCRDTSHLVERAAREIAKLKRLRPAGDEARIPPPTPPMGPPPPPVKAFEGLRFEPRRHHASGGLGDVFVALDQEVGREVALKCMQPLHADEPDAQARFEREAEITGRLEHPGVVPLYGRGRDADGRPYYAMRFIRGGSLRDAIDEFYKPEHAKKDPGERAVAFRGLLQRFTTACNTTAYAHSRGVIHRDLKPDNIMLGPYGETLVVDWGLAKSVGRDEPARDPAEESVRPAALPDGEGTQTGAAVGTVAFMSVEQALGRKEVGPASDVFSLGATLHQLLTGQTPYRGALALVDAAAGKFPRPGQVRRDVPRALEAICLKAMAFRPEERYATALDLARDVDRWLADEPTAAYREPWRVRAWRWVKRHRTPVTATAAALLVAALMLGGGLWWKLDQDARAAAAAARQAEERDGDVRAGLVEVGRLRDQGRLGEARKALEVAEKLAASGSPAELVERVRQARKDLDMVAELEETPLLETQIHEGGFDLAGVLEGYGKAFQKYGIDVEIMEPAEAAARIRASDIGEQLIVALDGWASLLPTEDRERFRRLVEVAGRADGDDQRKQLRQAWAQANRQALEALLDHWDIPSLPPTTADAVSRRLLQLGSVSRSEQLLRAVQHVHPNDFWVNHELYRMLSKTPAGREEAIGFLRAALAVKPDSPGAHYNLGNVLSDRGRPEEAEKEYHRAVQLKDDYAEPHYNLGVLLDKQGKRKEALKEYRRAVQLKEGLPEAHNNLGVVLRAQGRPEEAEKEYRRAIQLRDNYPEAHDNLGLLLKRLGRPEEAEKEYRRAILLKEDDPEAHNNLANLLADRRLPGEAMMEYRRAILLKEDYPEAHNNLANQLANRGWPQEAEKEYRRAIQLEEGYPEAHNNLGNLLADRGRLEEAEREYRRALVLKKDYPEAHNNLGSLLDDLGRPEEAAKEYHRAIQLKDDYPKAHWGLGIVLQHQGKFGEAILSLQQALKLLPPADSSRARLEKRISRCKHLLELDNKLPAVLNGEVQVNAPERIDFAQVCRDKRRYVASTRFSTEAFAQQPALADDLGAHNRYNAACVAALAGVGKGEDSSGLDDQERARLRNQALDWLRADLTAWEKRRQDDPKACPKIQQTLRHWRADADLAGVREADALAKLPETEREAWRKLWDGVAGLLTQVDDSKQP